MKKIVLIFAVAVITFCQKTEAQVTQLELVAGFYKSEFSSFSMKPLNEKKTFSFSTLAFFQKYHRSEDLIFDETGVQATAYWNFSKAVSMGPSLYYNSAAGFSERFSFLVFKGGDKIVFIAVPSIVYTENTNDINGDLFIQIQFMQPLKKEWSFIGYTQLLTNWNKFSTHSRSFQQLRIGLSHNNNQFGIAADFDQYGEKPITKTTIGVFVRKVFIEK
jgi:hypothetical protein